MNSRKATIRPMRATSMMMPKMLIPAMKRNPTKMRRKMIPNRLRTYEDGERDTEGSDATESADDEEQDSDDEDQEHPGESEHDLTEEPTTGRDCR